MANRAVIGFIVLFVVFLAVASVISIYNNNSFVIPGLAPTTFKKGDHVSLKVNKVASTHSPIPFRYHDLPVCTPPDDSIEYKAESLGEVLLGNRVESSLYELNFLEPVTCKRLCNMTLTAKDVHKLRELVVHEYMVDWQVDGIPAAMKARTKSGKVVHEAGFPLGAKSEKGDIVNLNNHVNIIIHYSMAALPTDTDGTITPRFNIVLFEVQPTSIAYYGAGRSESNFRGTCMQATRDGVPAQSLTNGTARPVLYTYSVEWQRSNIEWANRWQIYLQLQEEGQVHWFSIINSTMIVLFLSGMVAMILARTLRRDIGGSVISDNEPAEVDETGWKRVHNDVFRPPRFRMLFATLVGSGSQIFAMGVTTMVFAVLGFLSPANQGSLATALLVLYVWMGVVAGYTSSRTYQAFEGPFQTRATLMTAFFFPGVIFCTAFFLNCFLWALGSSGAFPFLTMLAIMALWFCISVPLCFLGSRLAYRRPPPKHPGKVTIVEHRIPPQAWYMNSLFTILMGGILPFGAVFIELFFILSSIWLLRFYYLFGFLFLVFLILVITCAEITVVMIYFQLCAEDHRWWWRSFLTSGASAFYVFLYSVFYYITRLEVEGFIPTLLYFGYSLIICLCFFVMTGSIGYYASYWFVKKIYGAIHSD